MRGAPGPGTGASCRQSTGRDFPRARGSVGSVGPHLLVVTEQVARSGPSPRALARLHGVTGEHCEVRRPGPWLTGGIFCPPCLLGVSCPRWLQRAAVHGGLGAVGGKVERAAPSAWSPRLGLNASSRAAVTLLSFQHSPAPLGSCSLLGPSNLGGTCSRGRGRPQPPAGCQAGGARWC